DLLANTYPLQGLSAERMHFAGRNHAFRLGSDVHHDSVAVNRDDCSLDYFAAAETVERATLLCCEESFHRHSFVVASTTASPDFCGVVYQTNPPTGHDPLGAAQRARF